MLIVSIKYCVNIERRLIFNKYYVVEFLFCILEMKKLKLRRTRNLAQIHRKKTMESSQSYLSGLPGVYLGKSLKLFL
jgi:hypothetical protein